MQGRGPTVRASRCRTASGCGRLLAFVLGLFPVSVVPHLLGHRGVDLGLRQDFARSWERAWEGMRCVRRAGVIRWR